MTAKASNPSKRSSARHNQQQQQHQHQQPSSPNSSSASPSPGSTAAGVEPRRANKPLMEKRRRARINQSLAVLKTLILDSAKSDNTKHSKLEKADILELTVRHFQRHRNLDTPGINKYRAGYADCVREVQRYLETPDAQTMCVIEPGIRQRLLRHLENCVTEIDTDISPTVAPTATSTASATVLVQQPHHPQEITNVFKEVLTNHRHAVDTKRISISTPSAMDYTPTKLEPIQHISESSLPTDMLFNGTTAANMTTTTDEKKVRLEADSSTVEEINNNGNISSRMEPEVGVAPQQQHVGSLPNNVIRMYDGNFVFVLPSHYVQLAAALGINLNNQVGGSQVPVAETSSTPETARTQVDAQTPVGVVAAEKPLDYSKNNECNDSMWRPW